MDSARMAELLAPYTVGLRLPPGIFEQLNSYLDLLLRWNARTNLTAVRQPESIVTRHFGESLFAAGVLFGDVTSNPAVESGAMGAGAPPRSPVLGQGGMGTGSPPASPIFGQGEEGAGGPPLSPTLAEAGGPVSSPNLAQGGMGTTLADVGSGAGFPGVPIKLAFPGLRVTLIESQNKKATFLKELVRALGLDGIEVFNGRAEDWGRQAEVVTLRAVERFEAILPVSEQIVSPKGRFCLLISARQRQRVGAMLMTTIQAQVEKSIPESHDSFVWVGIKS